MPVSAAGSSSAGLRLDCPRAHSPPANAIAQSTYAIDVVGHPTPFNIFDALELLSFIDRPLDDQVLIEYLDSLEAADLGAFRAKNAGTPLRAQSIGPSAHPGAAAGGPQMQLRPQSRREIKVDHSHARPGSFTLPQGSSVRLAVEAGPSQSFSISRQGAQIAVTPRLPAGEEFLWCVLV